MELKELKEVRRPRKRKPTLNPRFKSKSIALEISLVRMALEVQRELIKSVNNSPNPDK